ncbi:MAG: glycine cleavage system protein GcvH [Desulfomonilaceae bacterium]|nr:glycine cleavage system protein GcvH [Desulfomonilaceae bacterium]
MKRIEELNLPMAVRYAEDHEWVRSAESTVIIGISDYAQDQLGDITYVELPAVGDSFERGDEFGTLESVKAVSELFMPMGGRVVAVNEDLGETPGLINEDPYGRGWIVEIEPSDVREMDALMDARTYREMLRGFE